MTGLTCGLNNTLEYDDDLKLLPEQVVGGEVIERRVFVDLVHDGHGPDEEDAVLADVVAHVELVLEEGENLPLPRHPFPDELRSDVRLDDVRLPHVPDPEQEAHLPVAEAEAGVPGEHEGLRPLLGTRQLGEDDAYHERLGDGREVSGCCGAGRR